MTTEPGTDAAAFLVAEWPFPVAAALGSTVRAKGIGRELRARLPWTVRNRLTVGTGGIALGMPANEAAGFEAASEIVSKALAGIDALPVLPSEVEDILTITARERLKWTGDGRLPSAGTRTVKLRGRAKAVTFHVFDPRDVEDIFDRDLPTLWREEDARAAAENRKRAAGKAALTRAGGIKRKPGESRAAGARNETPRPKLEGWESFETDGLLR